MADRVVVDASAIAAILFGEPDGADLLERIGSAELLAPELIGFEVANTGLKKMQRHPDSGAAILAALSRFDTMPICRCDVDLCAVTLLAQETGLTAYDASYLWLARTSGARLVTLDKKLARAAGH